MCIKQCNNTILYTGIYQKNQGYNLTSHRRKILYIYCRDCSYIVATETQGYDNTVQLKKFFSPVCVIIWKWILLLSEIALSHSLKSPGFSPVCVINVAIVIRISQGVLLSLYTREHYHKPTRIIDLVSCEKSLSHCPELPKHITPATQGYVFSPVWIIFSLHQTSLNS